MSTADEQEPVLSGVQSLGQPRDLGENCLRSQFHCARGGSEDLRNPRCEWTEVDAVRIVLEALQGEAVRFGAEGIPERAQSQHHVQAPFVTRPVGQHRGELSDVAAGHR